MKKLWSKKNAPLVILAVLGVVVLGAFAYLTWQNFFKKGYELQVELQKCESASDKDICRFRAHLKNNDSYRTHITNQASATSIYEVDSGKKRLVAKGPNGSTYEVVMQDSTAYYKTNGVWYRQLNACGPQPCPGVNPLQITDEVHFKKVGKEKCGDLTCFKYETTVNDGTKTIVAGTIWFDDTQYKLRRTVGQDTRGKMEVTYEYGNINISIPDDYKDASTQKAAQSQMPSTASPTPATSGLPTLPSS